MIFEPPVSLYALVRATTERGFGSRIKSSIDSMTAIGFLSVNVRYPTKSMMPRGNARRILGNAPRGKIARDDEKAGRDYRLGEASTFQRG
jgi:hypothetical protein